MATLRRMPLFTINTDGQLHPGLEQEWLLTNGAGAYSSSTIVGCNTRRYHGLLCAATLPPVGRIIALSRIGELLQIDDDTVTHELSINQFGNNFHPRGDQYLRSFSVDNTAQWNFEVEGVTIKKELTLQEKRNTISLRYTIDPGTHQSIQLQLLPFVALRDFHSLRRGTDAQFAVNSDARSVSTRDGNYTLNISSDAGQFNPSPDWWRGHFYAIEAERGQDCLEDLFTPGRFVVQITKPTTITLIASTDSLDSIKTIAASPIARTSASPVMQKLHRAAADFIVDRKNPDGTMGSTVMAGYPWFADWGRDTMISLPGLFLTTGRVKEAGDVLCLFAEYVSQGMIPNRFDDYTNEPSYNTVDASLWFIHACFEYLKSSKDNDRFERKLLPACKAIIDGYSHGTRYHIKMDDDGLITQGDQNTQLTWMDAKCNNVAFTPRQGKAVEINALWYNALKLLKMEDLTAKVKASFVKTFWISPFRGLYDVVNPQLKDAKIRPNQIFAASLPYSPLSDDQQAAVVEVVRRELLTPYGLRTLSPSDPNFHATYIGDQFHRDGAYHNGTIWPWLIGSFLEAYLKVNKNSPQAVDQVKSWLQPLLTAMDSQGCIGQLAEIYEAQPPYRPVGCFAQAWSVAEVLRIAAMIRM